MFAIGLDGVSLRQSMIPNLVHILAGQVAPDVARQAFVREVAVRDAESRNPRVERLILICWVLIALKHVAVIWAVRHYPIPFDQLWVNAPTWLLGTLATGLYFWRVRAAQRD